MPNQKERRNLIEKKYVIDYDKIKGKDLILVDDSIVRGNTMKMLIKQVRKGEPKSIHIRVASPPLKAPCHYGIDFPTYTELIGHNKNIEEIRKYIDVESLKYLEIQDIYKAINIENPNMCTSCFSNNYKLDMFSPFENVFKNSWKKSNIEYQF